MTLGAFIFTLGRGVEHFCSEPALIYRRHASAYGRRYVRLLNEVPDSGRCECPVRVGSAIRESAIPRPIAYYAALNTSSANCAA